jgi:hypothetical protein
MANCLHKKATGSKSNCTSLGFHGEATAIRIISSRVTLSKEAKASTGTVTIMGILRHFHSKLFYNAEEY